MKKESAWRWGWISITVILLLAAIWRPDTVIKGASKGLVLWYTKVLPVQFPFLMLVKMLLHLQGGRLPAMLTIWAGGWLAGFPAGSFLAAQQYQQGNLQEKELLPAVLLANTSGPLFIIGTVGVGMLNSQQQGVYLLLIHWVAAVITAFLFWPKERRGKKKGRFQQVIEPLDIGKMLADSAAETADVMVKVAEFIVFFAVVSALISSVGIGGGLFVGVLEITGGIQRLIQREGSSVRALSESSFLLGFCGLSIFFQTASVLRKVPCRSGKLFVGFFCRGVIAAALSLGIAKLTGH